MSLAKRSKPIVRWALIRKALPILLLAVYGLVWWRGIHARSEALSSIAAQHEARVRDTIHALKAKGITVDTPGGEQGKRRRYIDDAGLIVWLDPPQPSWWNVELYELQQGQAQLNWVFLVGESVALLVAWPNLPATLLGGVIRMLGRTARASAAGMRSLGEWASTHWRG